MGEGKKGNDIAAGSAKVNAFTGALVGCANVFMLLPVGTAVVLLATNVFTPNRAASL